MSHRFPNITFPCHCCRNPVNISNGGDPLSPNAWPTKVKCGRGYVYFIQNSKVEYDPNTGYYIGTLELFDGGAFTLSYCYDPSSKNIFNVYETSKRVDYEYEVKFELSRNCDCGFVEGESAAHYNWCSIKEEEFAG